MCVGIKRSVFIIAMYSLLIFVITFTWTYGFFPHYPNPDIEIEAEVSDVGEPLFLTPYIESGEIRKARRLARVFFTESLHIKSYAGFFTVNKQYDSNQFFWYFPAMHNDKEAPVIVWLQGGPGVSSLYGLFGENGPIIIKNNWFKRRKYHWALNHHVIYIDNPVGTGFSFTNNPKGYCTDETQVGEQLYSTMVQFFKLFPELQNNNFFVTGESYGGKYVPALAYTIHTKNPTSDLKINLKGIAIGNGFSDPINQLGYGDYLYQIGIIDSNQAKVLEDYRLKVSALINNKQWKDASATLFEFIMGTDSFFSKISGFTDLYNYVQNTPFADINKIMQNTFVRKSIHVGKLPYEEHSYQVSLHLYEDFTKSVAPWISELLNHYKVLVYNGQLDIIVAYPLTVNYLSKLNFSGAEEYKTAERRIWRVDGDVAGYKKKAGNLTEVLVRNAGHMVPADQPKWALNMITDFIKGTF